MPQKELSILHHLLKPDKNQQIHILTCQSQSKTSQNLRTRC